METDAWGYIHIYIYIYIYKSFLFGIHKLQFQMYKIDDDVVIIFVVSPKSTNNKLLIVQFNKYCTVWYNNTQAHKNVSSNTRLDSIWLQSMLPI